MSGVWLWRAVLAALAPVVILAGLDRASYERPELSAVVPAPFRSIAQGPTALIALATESPEQAREEARRLVRRRPMPGEHLFTLAMAELRAGRPEAFAEVFRAASTRGWRFAPLQVAAAQAAIDNADAPGAAKRVGAVWALNGGHPSVPVLTKALLELPGGPEAFAEVLVGARNWRHNFLAQATQVTTPALALRTVALAHRSGARFDCAALESFAAAMARAGLAAEALVCR